VFKRFWIIRIRLEQKRYPIRLRIQKNLINLPDRTPKIRIRDNTALLLVVLNVFTRTLVSEPLSLWHNRWQQTTPIQRKIVARSIHVAKHFAKRFDNKWRLHFAFLKVHIINKRSKQRLKPTQQVKSLINRSHESRHVMQKSKLPCVLKEQLKHFPTIGAKDLRVDFDSHKVHLWPFPSK